MINCVVCDLHSLLVIRHTVWYKQDWKVDQHLCWSLNSHVQIQVQESQHYKVLLIFCSNSLTGPVNIQKRHDMELITSYHICLSFKETRLTICGLSVDWPVSLLPGVIISLCSSTPEAYDLCMYIIRASLNINSIKNIQCLPVQHIAHF